MKVQKLHIIGVATLLTLGLAVTLPIWKAAANHDDSQFIASSSLLAGLAPGAAFPFIDITPHVISSAHIAITDATTNCSPGAAAPSNVKVLVGNAGAVPPVLVSVMGGSTNLGISTTPGQCVFHATIRAGQGGVPDITGINTVTASAIVRVNEVAVNWHQHDHGASGGN
ncbi:MAG: hypothetical protein DMG49_02330 [Acidobacteria bacterium]|nr:MAG: hypothetical protein DMG49_02330 [Acidobacteriota bacterium]